VHVDVFRRGPGDSWPPAGKIALLLRAENFPDLSCGVQCTYLEFRRLARADEPDANPPLQYRQYRTCEELIDANGAQIYWRQPGMEFIGNVNVSADGVINQWLLVDDTPENWTATWVLTDWGLVGLTPIRCGRMTVAPS
jgi:hypothetical protein